MNADDATPPASPPDAPYQDPAATTDRRSWATWMHLSTLAMIVTGGLPLVGPILWIVKKDEAPFLNDHGREVTNFQITLFLYALVGYALAFVCIGFLVFPAIAVLALIGLIQGAQAANRGQFYRYPMTIRLFTGP